MCVREVRRVEWWKLLLKVSSTRDWFGIFPQAATLTQLLKVTVVKFKESISRDLVAQFYHIDMNSCNSLESLIIKTLLYVTAVDQYPFHTSLLDPIWLNGNMVILTLFIR